MKTLVKFGIGCIIANYITVALGLGTLSSILMSFGI